MTTIAVICHQCKPLTIGSEKCFHRDPNESLSLILPLLGNQSDPVGTEGQGLAKDLCTCLRLSTRRAPVKWGTFMSDFIEQSWTLQLLGISADCICINKGIVLLTSISWALHGRERWRREKSGWKVGCWRKIRDWRKSAWLFQQLQNLPSSQKGELKWAACHSCASTAHKGQPGHGKAWAQPNARHLFSFKNHLLL